MLTANYFFYTVVIRLRQKISPRIEMLFFGRTSKSITTFSSKISRSHFVSHAKRRDCHARTHALAGSFFKPAFHPDSSLFSLPGNRRQPDPQHRLPRAGPNPVYCLASRWLWAGLWVRAEGWLWAGVLVRVEAWMWG